MDRKKSKALYPPIQQMALRVNRLSLQAEEETRLGEHTTVTELFMNQGMNQHQTLDLSSQAV